MENKENRLALIVVMEWILVVIMLVIDIYCFQQGITNSITSILVTLVLLTTAISNTKIVISNNYSNKFNENNKND